MLVKYSPKRINGSWNNIQFLGYMDGTFAEVEYAEDAVTTHVGSGGDVSLVLNANLLATVTVTLIQGSPTNDLLSKLVPNRKRNSIPTGQFSLSDLNGTSLVNGANAFIRKMAKIEWGKNITGRQWVFVIPEADVLVGQGGT